MKDLVANRRRLDLAGKLAGARLALRENGLLWTAWLGLYLATSALADFAFVRAEARRRRGGLPGLNSPEMNRLIWSRWNWQDRGEEWTYSAAWKDAILAELLRPNVPDGASILEIGPGAGRWTGELIRRASRFIAFDISPKCIEICQELFAADSHAEFRVSDGSSLPGVPDRSIDAVWSFDVFVHINPAEVGRYLEEIGRVLAPGGRAIIHHGTEGGRSGGWRSNLTAGEFDVATTRSGLILSQRLLSCQTGAGSIPIGQAGDAVSILERPRP